MQAIFGPMIPKIIHQTWKTDRVPPKARPYVDKVRQLNPDWEYKLWTDDDNLAFVRSEFPELLEIYEGFSRGIMRADVIRYMIMYKMGGVYLDLDYEVLYPFEFGDHRVVLPLSRSVAFGHDVNIVGNCFFASEPGHALWADLLRDLKENPPITNEYIEVLGATGPQFVSRIYFAGDYPDVHTPEKMAYHPPAPKSRADYEVLLTNGVTRGIHHTWGTWRERLSLGHIKLKINKWLGRSTHY